MKKNTILLTLKYSGACLIIGISFLSCVAFRNGLMFPNSNSSSASASSTAGVDPWISYLDSEDTYIIAPGTSYEKFSRQTSIDLFSELDMELQPGGGHRVAVTLKPDIAFELNPSLVGFPAWRNTRRVPVRISIPGRHRVYENLITDATEEKYTTPYYEYRFNTQGHRYYFEIQFFNVRGFSDIVFRFLSIEDEPLSDESPSSNTPGLDDSTDSDTSNPSAGSVTVADPWISYLNNENVYVVIPGTSYEDFSRRTSIDLFSQLEMRLRSGGGHSVAATLKRDITFELTPSLVGFPASMNTQSESVPVRIRIPGRYRAYEKMIRDATVERYSTPYYEYRFNTQGNRYYFEVQFFNVRGTSDIVFRFLSIGDRALSDQYSSTSTPDSDASTASIDSATSTTSTTSADSDSSSSSASSAAETGPWISYLNSEDIYIVAPGTSYREFSQQTSIELFSEFDMELQSGGGHRVALALKRDIIFELTPFLVGFPASMNAQSEPVPVRINIPGKYRAYGKTIADGTEERHTTPYYEYRFNTQWDQYYFEIQFFDVRGSSDIVFQFFVSDS